jgi:hypothetical protein
VLSETEQPATITAAAADAAIHRANRNLRTAITFPARPQASVDARGAVEVRFPGRFGTKPGSVPFDRLRPDRARPLRRKRASRRYR